VLRWNLARGEVDQLGSGGRRRGRAETYRCGIQSGQRRHGGGVTQRVTPGNGA